MHSAYCMLHMPTCVCFDHCSGLLARALACLSRCMRLVMLQASLIVQ